MRLKLQPAEGKNLAANSARFAKPVILSFASLLSTFILSAHSPALAYSEASSEAGSEAGRESGGYPGYGRRGRFRRYQQQQMQQQRMMAQQQKRQQKQQMMQQRQAAQRLRNQPTPHLQVTNYPVRAKSSQPTTP